MYLLVFWAFKVFNFFELTNSVRKELYTCVFYLNQIKNFSVLYILKLKSGQVSAEAPYTPINLVQTFKLLTFLRS